eukprot:CAMPEP_0172034486 /NCGR_PEP_ID=MMETSP1041-20130122/21040_1 /TAXON_ID=464988 /ORGANISM="Hemiselmis andersenii, Strain CCMP439" /LENGTH=60 /DNA_ID=CAMNT_0012691419 /DNA_START=26 /DNA_END=205 /DNA_ORIENTATION=-
MRWTPLSVSTGLDISPTFSPATAFSNAGCIAPLANGPRSPSLCAEEQSLSRLATSLNLAT